MRRNSGSLGEAMMAVMVGRSAMAAHHAMQFGQFVSGVSVSGSLGCLEALCNGLLDFPGSSKLLQAFGSMKVGVGLVRIRFKAAGKMCLGCFKFSTAGIFLPQRIEAEGVFGFRIEHAAKLFDAVGHWRHSM
jgi:hypothetical protein